MLIAMFASSGRVVSGTLSSVANRTYRIELFVSPGCNAAGYGPGRDLLDAFDVTTDGGGQASFSRTVAAAYAPGTTFAATSSSALEGPGATISRGRPDRRVCNKERVEVRSFSIRLFI